MHLIALHSPAGFQGAGAVLHGRRRTAVHGRSGMRTALHGSGRPARRRFAVWELRQFNAMNNYENIRIYNAFVGEEARA